MKRSEHSGLTSQMLHNNNNNNNNKAQHPTVTLGSDGTTFRGGAKATVSLALVFPPNTKETLHNLLVVLK